MGRNPGLKELRASNRSLKEEVRRYSALESFRVTDTYDKEVHPGIGGRLATCGFKDAELAYSLGISERTLARWYILHPEFKESVENAQAGTVKYLVGQAMRAAVGYEYEEVTKRYDSEGLLVGRTVASRQAAPNENLLMFLLTNLSGGEFRHTKNIEVKTESKSLTLTGSIDVLGRLEAEEIRKLSGRLAESKQIGNESHV